MPCRSFSGMPSSAAAAARLSSQVPRDSSATFPRSLLIARRRKRVSQPCSYAELANGSGEWHRQRLGQRTSARRSRAGAPTSVRKSRDVSDRPSPAHSRTMFATCSRSASVISGFFRPDPLRAACYGQRWRTCDDVSDYRTLAPGSAPAVALASSTNGAHRSHTREPPWPS